MSPEWTKRAKGRERLKIGTVKNGSMNLPLHLEVMTTLRTLFRVKILNF